MIISKYECTPIGTLPTGVQIISIYTVPPYILLNFRLYEINGSFRYKLRGSLQNVNLQEQLSATTVSSSDDDDTLVFVSKYMAKNTHTHERRIQSIRPSKNESITAAETRS